MKLKLNSFLLLSGAALLLGWAASAQTPIPGLFNTGVDAGGAALPDGTVDPHYVLTENPDSGSPDALVHDSTVFPIVAGPWLANTATSKWIAPGFDTVATMGQFFTYTTTFDLTGLDPATAQITGGWAVDNAGTDIVLNGNSLGIVNGAGFAGLTAFTISSGFVSGMNTLGFVVENFTPPGYTGLRVSGLRGVALAPGSAPVIITQPQGRTAAEGENVTLSVVAIGAGPLTYEWRRNGTAVPGGTSAELVFNPVTSANAGDYTVLVGNAFGSKLSDPATLSVVGVRIPGLFNTGVDDSGVALPDGEVDPHYQSSVNPDLGTPDAVVHDSTVFPIVAGPWVANNAASKWISPQFNTSGSAGAPDSGGDYTYRTSFDLTGLNHTTAQIEADWATDNAGIDIFLNGVSLGIPNTGQFATLTHFVIAAGNPAFQPGLNTLEFKLNNSAVGYTGLRVDHLRATATAIPPGSCPVIVTPPASRQARETETITLSVAAFGTPPLSYQWSKNGSVLAGETSSTLTLANITAAAAGTYSVRVSGLAICAPATASATLTVRPRLELDLALMNQIRIEGFVGRSYRIEFSDDGGGTYAPLTTIVLATEPQVYVDLSSRAQPNRLYRVILLP